MPQITPALPPEPFDEEDGGFVGIAVGRTQWLLGCERIGIEPIGLEAGRLQDVVFFDLDRLVLVEHDVFRKMTSRGERPKLAENADANLPDKEEVKMEIAEEAENIDEDGGDDGMDDDSASNRHVLLMKNCQSYRKSGGDDPCRFHSNYPDDPRPCNGGPPTVGREDLGGLPSRVSGYGGHGFQGRKDI